MTEAEFFDIKLHKHPRGNLAGARSSLYRVQCMERSSGHLTVLRYGKPSVLIWRYDLTDFIKFMIDQAIRFIGMIWLIGSTVKQ